MSLTIVVTDIVRVVVFEQMILPSNKSDMENYIKKIHRVKNIDEGGIMYPSWIVHENFLSSQMFDIYIKCGQKSPLSKCDMKRNTIFKIQVIYSF